MNKAVEIFALAAGIAAFLIVLIFSSSGAISRVIEWLNIYLLDFMGIIKAVLAFLAVSIMAKIILGKINVRIMEQKRKEMIEKMKLMQKQQKENEDAENK